MTYKVQIDDLIRDATPDEIAQIEAIRAETKAKELEAESKAQAKADLLERLGISATEAELLLS